MKQLDTGLKAEIEITVSETETAARLGSGLVPVYATPALVALMENTAVQILEGHLPDRQTTVGGQIDLRHLAATPVGMKVHARAELLEVNGRKLTFTYKPGTKLSRSGKPAIFGLLLKKISLWNKSGKRRKQ